MKLTKEISTFIETHINNYSSIPLALTNLSDLTEDPGNEHLSMDR